jgi:hypothetical protein
MQVGLTSLSQISVSNKRKQTATIEYLDKRGHLRTKLTREVSNRPAIKWELFSIQGKTEFLSELPGELVVANNKTLLRLGKFALLNIASYCPPITYEILGRVSLSNCSFAS